MQPGDPKQPKTMQWSWAVFREVSLQLNNRVKRPGLCLGDHDHGYSIPAFKTNQAYHIPHAIMCKYQPAGKSSFSIYSQDHHPLTCYRLPAYITHALGLPDVVCCIQDLFWQIFMFRVPSLVYWFIFPTQHWYLQFFSLFEA